MRRLVPILIALMLVFCCTSYADETDGEVFQMYVLCKPNDYVNARYRPSTKSEVMGRLDCGDAVDTCGETKKDNQGRTWVKIFGFEANEAWVCKSYLQESPVVVCECTGYVERNGRVALRKLPNGKRIKWLKNGEEVNIIAMSDEWVLTEKGYVKREMLYIEEE